MYQTVQLESKPNIKFPDVIEIIAVSTFSSGNVKEVIA